VRRRSTTPSPWAPSNLDLGLDKTCQQICLSFNKQALCDNNPQRDAKPAGKQTRVDTGRPPSTPSAAPKRIPFKRKVRLFQGDTEP
jgi:hypothetical protein